MRRRDSSTGRLRADCRVVALLVLQAEHVALGLPPGIVGGRQNLHHTVRSGAANKRNLAIMRFLSKIRRNCSMNGNCLMRKANFSPRSIPRMARRETVFDSAAFETAKLFYQISDPSMVNAMFDKALQMHKGETVLFTRDAVMDLLRWDSSSI